MQPSRHGFCFKELCATIGSSQEGCLLDAGGEILASSTISEAYEHGKGPITVRGKAFIEGSDEIEEDEPEASTSTDSRRKQPRRKVWLSPE